MATKEEILESIAQMSVMDVADLIKMMEELLLVLQLVVLLRLLLKRSRQSSQLFSRA